MVWRLLARRVRPCDQGKPLGAPVVPLRGGTRVRRPRGLIAGAGGMLCFYLALSFGEVSRVKPIAFSLAPAIAVMLGVLFLHEAFDWRKAGGVALIIAGVIVLATASGAHKNTAPSLNPSAASVE